jgi:hypothetical protein
MDDMTRKKVLLIESNRIESGHFKLLGLQNGDCTSIRRNMTFHGAMDHETYHT